MRTVAFHKKSAEIWQGLDGLSNVSQEIINTIMESPADTGPTCPGGGPRAAGVTTTGLGDTLK